MLSRRKLLGLGATAAVAASPIAALGQFGPKRRRVLRIAHITDIHVQPELNAMLGMERCLTAAQNHRPDVLFIGGDMVMDALSRDFARVKTLWNSYLSVLRANAHVPVRTVLGNHDVWGWCDKAAYRNQPGYGKAYAQERLEMSRPYGSFDLAGWHFILLDSTHERRGNGYIGLLDDEQFHWLADDLARTPPRRPVLVMSHIPFMSVAAMFLGPSERMGTWHVPGALVHMDARKVKDLFHRHSNVKACLAGHIHMVDHVDYLGVSYYCNGAACGGWWRGPCQEFANGYAIVDLFADGTVVNRFFPFAWRPAV